MDIDSERTIEVIDSLTGEDGAYLETTLLGWSIPNEGRVSFDNRMPENIELMEYAPEADFYWRRWPEDQKGLRNHLIRFGYTNQKTEFRKLPIAYA